MTASKKCSKCGADKPLTEFHRHSGSSDGRRADCKACRNQYHAEYRKGLDRESRSEYMKRWREAHPGYSKEWYSRQDESKREEIRAKVRERLRRYRSVGKGAKKKGTEKKRRIGPSTTSREVLNRYQRRYRRKYRDRDNARRAVYWSIQRGEMPRVSLLSCIECGNQAQEYHHHNGYDEKHWLDVVPVCIPCHRSLDRQ